jgi:hypothetical protein
MKHVPDCIHGFFNKLRWRFDEWRVDYEIRHGLYKQYNSVDEFIESLDAPKKEEGK